MTTNVCHSDVRSLIVLPTLSFDHQLQVHRKLVSFISQFEPEHDLFVQVPRSNSLNIKIFKDEGWQPTGDAVLNLESYPKVVASALDKCPIQNWTLSGWLRAGVAQPRAKLHIWMSLDWLSPTTEIWPPPYYLSGATPPATRGDPHSSSLEAEPVHDSASASSVFAGFDGPRMAQQEDVALDEQDLFGARVLQQTLNGEFLSTRHAEPHFAMETPLSPQSEILPDDEHPRPSEQPSNKAVSTPLMSYATHPTVTVNFLDDGTRPLRRPKGRARAPFRYLSYRGVPTSVSLGILIRRIRPKDMDMLGVTVISRKWIEVHGGMITWCAEETYLEGTPAMRKTLLELGWGSRMDPVWLAILR